MEEREKEDHGQRNKEHHKLLLEIHLGTRVVKSHKALTHISSRLHLLVLRAANYRRDVNTSYYRSFKSVLSHSRVVVSLKYHLNNVKQRVGKENLSRACV